MIKFDNLPMLLILTVLGVSTLPGCSSQLPAIKLDPKVEYKFVGKVCDYSRGSDGTCFDGVGVLPNREKYELKMYATRADLVKIRSCNRTRQLLYEGGSFNFVMTPNEVEKNLVDCQISGEAYDYKKELHSFYWALLERKGFELPVETQCDGSVVGPSTGAPAGIGACQIGQGLTGYINFATKTKVYNDREVCPFEFFYLDKNGQSVSVEIGRDFYFTPTDEIKGGKYVCEFLEQVPPFRKALVGIRLFEEEIFPKENK